MDKNYDLVKSCDRRLKAIEITTKNLVEIISKMPDDLMSTVTMGVKAALAMQGLCFIQLSS